MPSTPFPILLLLSFCLNQSRILCKVKPQTSPSGQNLKTKPIFFSEVTLQEEQLVSVFLTRADLFQQFWFYIDWYLMPENQVSLNIN
jgi:hypothetical protein